MIGLIIIVFISGCAQIVPLNGGIKDTSPPKPLKSVPQNGSVNVSSKTIVIEFDEFIQLNDVQNQLIVTPQLKEFPDIAVKGKSLFVKFNEGLLPNMTYCLNFGNAITDLHEGNQFKGYAFVFATGPSIDSLKLVGKLIDAFSLEPIKDAWVMLYSDLSDSVVYRDKPMYIGKSFADGSYALNYLKEGEYKVVALKDKNKNFLFDPEEQIGFVSDSVLKLTHNDTLNMFMFKETPEKVFLKKVTQPYYGKAILAFNTSLGKEVEVTIKNLRVTLDEETYMFNLSPKRDTINIYYHDLFSDTLTVIIKHDEINADTCRVYAPNREEVQRLVGKQRLPFWLFPNFNSSKPVPYFKKIAFRTSGMYRGYDAKKISLIEGMDTIPYIKAQYEQDSPDSFHVGYNFKAGKKYQLQFLPGAFEDFLDITNDTVEYKFKTDTKEDYGTLILNLTLPINHNWILQVYNEKGVIARELVFDSQNENLEKRSAKKIVIKNLEPETYSLKLIDDVNGDKKYTSGIYNKNFFPEKVYNYTQSLKLLADWEQENEWKIGE